MTAVRRVLFVDDDTDLLAGLRRTLRLPSTGWQLEFAAGGAQALDRMAERTFDAVVSDLRMPDIDGAALWREIKDRWPALALRMLFVTGDTLSRGAESFLAETGCPSLEKPFTRAVLLERVRGLLQG